MSVKACRVFRDHQFIGMQDEQLRACIQVVEDKKGEDWKVFHVSGIADYMLLVTCNSEAHLKALGYALYEVLKQHGTISRIDYQPQSGWFVLDAFDFVTHLMTAEMRLFYRLDRLWGCAPIVTASDFPVDFKAETAAYTA